MNQARLRAPERSGEVLAVPQLGAWLGVADRNARTLESASIRNQALGDLRRQARAEALRLAHREVELLGLHAPPGNAAGLWLASGHQPELAHPGVWLKTWATGAAARAAGGVGLNIVVDTDLVKSTGITVPSATPELSRAVPMANLPTGVPYEEVRDLDEAQFAAFSEAVAAALGRVPWTPLLPTWWPGTRLDFTANLAQRLTAARRRYEASQGLVQHEVMLSDLCQCASMAQLARLILVDLPEFVTVHNEILGDYRRRHRLRSTQHPFPDLDRAGEWWEAPFWVWRTGQIRRGRLFVKSAGGTFHLAIRSGSGFEELPWTWPIDGREFAEAWRANQANHLKVRTRALTTTLAIRLLLADLFVHGIGGAIYDEVTDGLLRRFFGIEPPPFAVLTGTLRLPFAVPPRERSVQDAQREWRLVWHHPEAFLPSDRAEVMEKHALLRQTPLTPAGRRQRFRDLLRLTEALRPAVAERLAEAAHRRESALAWERATGIWRNREYAAVLHPEAALQSFFAQVRGFDG